MNLYLMRHGEAEAIASSDSNRQLTENGRKNVAKVAREFAAKSPVIDRCFASPYVRAQQTGKLLLSALSPSVEMETLNLLVPEIPAIEVVRFLESLDVETVLLVSHNPLLTELVALLNKGHLEDIYIVNTSELLFLAMDEVGLGMATIEYTLT